MTSPLAKQQSTGFRNFGARFQYKAKPASPSHSGWTPATFTAFSHLVSSARRNFANSAGPVPAGSRVRARFRLAAVEDIAQGVQTTWNVTVEREGEAKPVLVAEWLTRRHE